MGRGGLGGRGGVGVGAGRLREGRLVSSDFNNGGVNDRKSFLRKIPTCFNYGGLERTVSENLPHRHDKIPYYILLILFVMVIYMVIVITKN